MSIMVMTPYQYTAITYDQVCKKDLIAFPNIQVWLIIIPKAITLVLC